MKKYENLSLDQERALYGVQNAQITHCVFAGPADGESALKETQNIAVKDCRFDLRYPLWHVRGGALENCRMSDTCRAALWYGADLQIRSCELGGIKALRECDNITLTNCRAVSQEFGWFCRNIRLEDVTLESEYPFMHTQNMQALRLHLKGKYSFQYTQNLYIKDSVLDTKDAFWHCQNVTVENSVVKGEYLGWYSQNLKFVNCRIIGTQPLCYAKGLTLENCTMEKTDLAFENSDVRADVRGSIESVKNPLSGFICADEIGQVILDGHQKAGSCCRIQIKNAQKPKEALCTQAA